MIVYIYIDNINISSATQIPAGQNAGATLKSYRDMEEKEKLITEVRAKKKTKEAPIEDVSLLDELEILPDGKQDILVKEVIIIEIEEVEYKDEVFKIAQDYEDRKLTIEDIEKLKNDITQLCRSKGITDVNVRTPEQDFHEGILKVYLIKIERD
jgi:hemolysin activation/secretion protein